MRTLTTAELNYVSGGRARADNNVVVAAAVGTNTQSNSSTGFNLINANLNVQPVTAIAANTAVNV